MTTAEPIVFLIGDIDLEGAGSGRTDVLAAIDANPGATITIDLSLVSFLDAAGLSLLVSALRRARSSGGSVVLANIPPRVSRVLDVTGFDRPFGI